MEATTLYTPGVDIHESVAKPQPLRIVKRPETPACTFQGKIVSGHARSSGSETSTSDRGSPPAGPERPLIVPKIRKGMNSQLDRPIDIQRTGISRSDTSPKLARYESQDPDITPRAKQSVPRTMSAGQFLKAELHGTDLGTRSLRGAPDDLEFEPSYKRSKHKSMFFRAIGSRGHDNYKTMQKVNHRSGSFATGKTLIRRLSQRAREASRSDLYYSNSDHVLCNSQDIAEVPTNSSISSSRRSSSITPSVTSQYDDSLILCPAIQITPEIESGDTGECIFWVAIEISGILRNGHGFAAASHDILDQDPFGRLFAMRIDLIPGRGCKICEVYGDLHSLKVVQATQSHLFLAKIRLSKLHAALGHVKESSDDLISDLETHLGDSATMYLKVRLTYQHSALSNTRLTSETKATIKRHNSQSAWSPRSSSANFQNPVMELIQSYLPAPDAIEALQVISMDKARIPPASRTLMSGFRSSIPEFPPETDPARQIWSEMRRTSRSSRCYARNSSDDTESFVSERSEICDQVQSQRDEILQTALKNKRSVGQDTLRSIAPSLPGKHKAIGVTGLGLGMGWPFGWGRW